jgi:3-dehydroquinate synthetase
MKQVSVALGDRSYPIWVGDGLLKQLPEFVGTTLPKTRRVAVISNPTVFDIYGQSVIQSLVNQDIGVEKILIPDGEQFKTWDTLNQILTQLLTLKMDRHCAIIALGGGVVGDIAGFAAAIFQRGIPFIQLPTTLLSQVDSSVGGKVAVNHPLGKNMIGAFYQPRGVLIDTHTLQSLPKREISAGLAEVIKYGLIGDAAFFSCAKPMPKPCARLIPMQLQLRSHRVAMPKRALLPKTKLKLVCAHCLISGTHLVTRSKRV